MISESNNFDFDFSDMDREQLLVEATHSIKALGSELSGETPGLDSAMEDATRLLAELNQEIAKFSSFPDVIELNEECFTETGLPVPSHFKILSEHSKFYWLRFPITLYPLEKMPFTKLECAVEFNPGVSEGHLRPRAHMIFPDKRFKKLFEVTNSVEFGIGANFELEVSSGKMIVQTGLAQAQAEAGAEAKVGGKVDFILGPLTYAIKKAQLDHSPIGSEKVFWRLSDADFIREDGPNFVVVLQVPREVHQVKVAAALQAYHSFSFPSSLVEAIRYFRERLAVFFRKGAPIKDTQIWDVTPRL
jgi:hypothetical protein